MSLFHEIQTGLASLDRATIPFLHSNDLSCLQPTAFSTIGVTADSSAIDVSKRDPLRPTRVRAPFSDLTTDVNVHLSHSTSKDSLSFRNIIGVQGQRDSTLDSSHLPLPRVSLGSTTQLPSFLDFRFQTFHLSPAPSTLQVSTPVILSTTPSVPVLPPIQLLPESPIFPMFDDPHQHPLHRDPFQLPVFSHPNSPYVPWASPVRREIMRPLTPSSGASRCSVYSRPYSRSGARAPEPPNLGDATRKPPAKLLKLSKSLKCFRRSMKKTMTNVSQRIGGLRNTLACRRSKESGVRTQPSYAQAAPPLPSPHLTASLDCSDTDSLAVWLATRRQAMERQHSLQSIPSMDESEPYETDETEGYREENCMDVDDNATPEGSRHSMRLRSSGSLLSQFFASPLLHQDQDFGYSDTQFRIPLDDHSFSETILHRQTAIMPGSWISP